MSCCEVLAIQQTSHMRYLGSISAAFFAAFEGERLVATAVCFDAPLPTTVAFFRFKIAAQASLVRTTQGPSLGRTCSAQFGLAFGFRNIADGPILFVVNATLVTQAIARRPETPTRRFRSAAVLATQHLGRLFGTTRMARWPASRILIAAAIKIDRVFERPCTTVSTHRSKVVYLAYWLPSFHFFDDVR